MCTVTSSNERIPSSAVAGVLRKQRLVLEVANKRVWILTRSDQNDERETFLGNYWAVVDVVLRGWALAAIADMRRFGCTSEKRHHPAINLGLAGGWHACS